MDGISPQRWGTLFLAGIVSLGLGCAHGAGRYSHEMGNPSRVAQGAILGSMAGAALGAGIDHADRGRGALVGAVGGLVAGALLGHGVEEQEALYRDRYAHVPEDDPVWCDEHHTWEDPDDWLEPEDAPDVPEPPDAPDEDFGLAPPDVLFDPGSAQLSRGAKSHLRRVADRLRVEDDLELLLRGHTDGSGQEEFALSEQRARSVRAYLAEEGVAPRRIALVGFGDTQPVASTRSAEGRQRNRRVELVLRQRDPGPYS